MFNTEHVLGGRSAEHIAFIPHTLQFLVMMALTISYSSLMKSPKHSSIRKAWETPWGNTREWRASNNFQTFSSHFSFLSYIQHLGHCLVCAWKFIFLLSILKYSHQSKVLNPTFLATSTACQGFLDKHSTNGILIPHSENYHVFHTKTS